MIFVIIWMTPVALQFASISMVLKLEAKGINEKHARGQIYWKVVNATAQKMKFSITDFFSKCNQIRSFLRIWSHLLKRSVIEIFISCAVFATFLNQK